MAPDLDLTGCMGVPIRSITSTGKGGTAEGRKEGIVLSIPPFSLWVNQFRKDRGEGGREARSLGAEETDRQTCKCQGGESDVKASRCS
mmetsp:Transcript_50989/g.100236  ORF Transcript_50989/g.100236 Transcript_50989/m.100236 type:complete len:88 (+) Transcript_50989:1469-1732(+)